MALEKVGIGAVFKEGQGDQTAQEAPDKVPAPPRLERPSITPQMARELDENNERLFPHAKQLRGGQERDEQPEENEKKAAYEFPELQGSETGLIQPERRKRGRQSVGNIFIRGPEDVCKRFEDFVLAGDFAAKWDALDYLLKFHDLNIKGKSQG